MKIFISHASQDRWIARQIDAELGRRGFDPFLDERTLQTGESIDAVLKHLKACDEVLMLLSPQALASAWVLIEIGAAKALNKRLIPIRYQITFSDMPDPLRSELSRDLDDIDTYYAELEQRASGRSSATPSAAVRFAPHVTQLPPFSAGDRVRIAKHPMQPFVTPYEDIVTWLEDMRAHAGKEAVVTYVDDDQTVQLDIDSNWWAIEWLEPLPPQPPEIDR